jgi:uncharacterized protein (TIGR03083 family)
MQFPWEDSRRAFRDAATCFLRTVSCVEGRWTSHGLGEWDVRALVGHTSRSLLTVEAYLAQPAAAVEVESAAGYFRATKEAAVGSEVAQRGRDAGMALGADPARALADLAERVQKLIDGCDGTELLTTFAGGMRLSDYLPTRTFELAVHTADLAVALDLPAELPASAATQALQLVTELAVVGGLAGPLLLTATGRPGLPQGSSVL